MSTLIQTIKHTARDIRHFTKLGGGLSLYPYEASPATAIVDTILKHSGLEIVLVFPRQSGKDETITNLIAYLMLLFAHREAGIVVVNPTYKPQTINAILRLENRLNTNLLTRTLWKKRADFMRMIGLCRVSFLSGDASANVVGATASLLLIINESQDIEPARYDKDFAPMVASTNATRVFAGTVWTSRTLLARQMRIAKEAQEADGIQRLFFFTADDVRKVNAAYGTFVDSEIRKLGREHPLVKTQYFCEEIDAQAGMFSAARRLLMTADQPEHPTPVTGTPYAFLIDVAGMDETTAQNGEDFETNPGRDSTTLSIVSMDGSTLEALRKPTYRVIHRRQWTGENHLTVFGQIKSLAESWTPQYIIVDATGVGEGLWALLDKAFPTRVYPVKFTAGEKSQVGYEFIAIIETGRFRDCATNETVEKQYSACTSEVLTGPAKLMRWGVKDGTRDENGALVHDDFILADALTAILDRLDWSLSTATTVINTPDVLESMDNAY